MTDAIIPKTFHCRRCHRDHPMESYAKHYKNCPGFASKCYETCPPTPQEPLARRPQRTIRDDRDREGIS